MEETIAKNAQGMFLIAKLHMDALKTKASPAAIIKALHTLPTELEKIYELALERIQHQSADGWEIATKLLSWVVYAYRPLTLSEIQHALAVNEGDDHFEESEISDADILLNVCGGLLIIDDTVRLVHHTAQEYFETSREIGFVWNA